MNSKKFTMLSIILIILIAIIVFSISIYKSIVYDTSEIYSEDRIENALEIVKSKLNEFDGCIIISLSYAGDDISLREANNRDYENIVVIKTLFISSLKAKGAWEPHSLYEWTFILGCHSEENWQIIDYGYA